MGFLTKSNIKKTVAISVAKKMITKDADQQQNVIEIASSTANSIAKGYINLLKFKLAVPLFGIGLIAFLFSPIYGFFICALALLLIFNTEVAVEFLILGVITINLYHAFNSINIAIAITLPTWILYNVFRFITAPNKQDVISGMENPPIKVDTDEINKESNHQTPLENLSEIKQVEEILNNKKA